MNIRKNIFLALVGGVLATLVVSITGAVVATHYARVALQRAHQDLLQRAGGDRDRGRPPGARVGA